MAFLVRGPSPFKTPSLDRMCLKGQKYSATTTFGQKEPALRVIFNMLERSPSASLRYPYWGLHCEVSLVTYVCSQRLPFLLSPDTQRGGLPFVPFLLETVSRPRSQRSEKEWPCCEPATFFVSKDQLPEEREKCPDSGRSELRSYKSRRFHLFL